MDLLYILVLVGGGLFGGVLSGLVGGGAIVTLPALLAVGLSPVVATATNIAAMTPGNLLAALVDRGRLPRLDFNFILAMLCSTAGALAGALLLLLTPARLFEALIPMLLGLATILFAYSRQVSDWVRARTLARHGREPRTDLSGVPFMLPVSIYGGYFGVGAGVMMLAVLSIWMRGDYRSANVTRNLIMCANSAGAAILFAYQGQVEWTPAAILMMGALVGSLIGGRIARVAAPHIMRIVVIAMGVLMTAIAIWRYWF